MTLSVATTVPAVAEVQDGYLNIELNNTQDNDQGKCRMTFVIRNRTGFSLSTAQFKMAPQDQNEKIQKLIEVNFGPLSAGNDHTQVLQFEFLDNTSCKDISQIIVTSDNTKCELEKGVPSFLCTEKRLLSSKKGAIPLK